MAGDHALLAQTGAPLPHLVPGVPATASPRDVPLSALLIGEQQVLLAGVHDALAADGVDVVATARDAAAAVRLVAESAPEVGVVLAPLAGGVVPAIVELRLAAAQLRLVVVSADEGPGGDLLLSALEAGADGWLSLDMPPHVLGRTLRAVRDGEPGISRAHVGRLLSALRGSRSVAVELRDGRTVQLNRRERQTLEQLLEDTSTAGVAERLGVSHSTARWHIASTLKRLGAESRKQVVALVVPEGELRTAQARVARPSDA